MDLARDILDGLGATYRQGGVRSPGYIVDTWRVWEDAISSACRIGYGAGNVSVQQNVDLGILTRRTDGWKPNLARVRPDIRVLAGKDTAYLIDAKYKGRGDDSSMQIAESDVYEALAFMEATKTKLTFLAYPAPRDLGGLGNIGVFANVTVGNRKIVAVEVQVETISQRFGLLKFAERFCGQIDKQSRS